MIFGGRREFVNFLRVNNAQPTMDDCAAVIPTGIPASLVLAVLPLGEYEREHLLVAA